MITIRKAKLTDLDRMMEIYARAKRFMDSTGNTTQWEIGSSPTKNLNAAWGMLSSPMQTKLYPFSISSCIIFRVG